MYYVYVYDASNAQSSGRLVGMRLMIYKNWMKLSGAEYTLPTDIIRFEEIDDFLIAGGFINGLKVEWTIEGVKYLLYVCLFFDK